MRLAHTKFFLSMYRVHSESTQAELESDALFNSVVPFLMKIAVPTAVKSINNRIANKSPRKPPAIVVAVLFALSPSIRGDLIG